MFRWREIFNREGEGLQCCSGLKKRYKSGPAAIADLANRLDQLSREELRPGFIVGTYRCRRCGQIWRYEQEMVGHVDVDECLYKLSGEMATRSEVS